MTDDDDRPIALGHWRDDETDNSERTPMTDHNQNGTVPQEQLLLGIFAGPQGMRIQSPMPPRELLTMLLGIVEQVREKVYVDAAKADARIAVVPAMAVTR